MNLYFFPIYIYNCFTGDGRGGRTGTLDSKDRGLIFDRTDFIQGVKKRRNVVLLYKGGVLNMKNNKY